MTMRMETFLRQLLGCQAHTVVNVKVVEADSSAGRQSRAAGTRSRARQNGIAIIGKTSSELIKSTRFQAILSAEPSNRSAC